MNNTNLKYFGMVLFILVASGISLAATFLSSEVKTKVTDKAIHISVGDKPVLTYNTETLKPPQGEPAYYARSGFIHPLYSPTGKVLTDGFPVGHVHQHAVFSAWTQATFKHEVVDFWNQHRETGTAKHVGIGEVSQDAFIARLQQVSLKKGPAINEEWDVQVKNSADPFIVDFAIEQSCATADEIYLHPYHYGGFGFRGSATWSREDTKKFEGDMKMLTGEGISDREKSNHTHPRWVAVYGSIEGKEAGFVVMDHPANFRYPQPIRMHPKMPYFVFSPVVDGSFILKPGLTYNAKYRIVTFDGAPKKDKIDAWYQEYLEE
ncbi:MAG: PmoA family protein [Cyclobacteriaceae bacterium]